MSKKKKGKKFCNLIIIDASGSMADKINEVKTGIVELVQDIKKDIKDNPENNYRTIIVDFSSAGDFNVLLNTDNKKKLNSDCAEKYEPRGMTALNDAIKKGFDLVPKGMDGVFVSIMTDGMENDSKEITKDALKAIIKEKREKDLWGITFMGVDENAVQAAVDIGIARGSTATYTNSAQGALFASSSRISSKTAYFTAVTSGTLTQDVVDNLTQEEEEDKEE